MALGLLCHCHRQGDSVLACQLVMRSLGQTSESHDRTNDTAFFLFWGGRVGGMGCQWLKADGFLLWSTKVGGYMF